VPVCPSCQHDVPEGRFCVRCGADLHGAGAGGKASARRWGRYAAAPHERGFVPRIVSTLYPHLPRGSMVSFRISLVLGMVLVLGLGVAGLFPVALVVAAALMPLITALYFFDVDLYEDEPLLVIAGTMLWGAAAGTVLGIVWKFVDPRGAQVLLQSNASLALRDGLALGVAILALAVAGPLRLLVHPRFNDVLDGATFGGASAVSLGAAFAIVRAIPLIGTGIRPVGSMVPWLYRLGAQAIATPLLLAGAVGGATGALWLRYRAPVRDRHALGPLGHPAVALGLAGSMIVAAGLARSLLTLGLALFVLAALDVAALTWLRAVIHLGLLEESAEAAAGPEIECPNCGHSTALQSFCGYCGIALRALPKLRWEGGARGTPAEEGL
jgi:hypothetical protein